MDRQRGSSAGTGPRLDVFDEHCDHVVGRHGLEKAHVRATATDVTPRDDGADVHLVDQDGQNSTLRAENVVLALGNDAPTVFSQRGASIVAANRERLLLEECIG